MDEASRLRDLKDYDLLDTPAEAEFDSIVIAAARRLNTPIALISLVDENRQWFKARYGIDLKETPRTISFCTHAIRKGETFVVNDATQDDRFSNNPMVTGDPHVRFYAGVPLRLPSGRRIGTLCVLDDRRRDGLDESEREALESLAAEVLSLLEDRRGRSRRLAS